MSLMVNIMWYVFHLNKNKTNCTSVYHCSKCCRESVQGAIRPQDREACLGLGIRDASQRNPRYDPTVTSASVGIQQRSSPRRVCPHECCEPPSQQWPQCIVTYPSDGGLVNDSFAHWKAGLSIHSVTRYTLSTEAMQTPWWKQRQSPCLRWGLAPRGEGAMSKQISVGRDGDGE